MFYGFRGIQKFLLDEPVDGKLTYLLTKCSTTCGPGTMLNKTQCSPSQFGGTACPTINQKEVKVDCPNPPKCECPPNLPAFHGPLQGSRSRENDTIIYACPIGSELKGNNVIKCQPNGKWEEPPTCQEKLCEDLISSVQNARVSYTKDVPRSDGDNATVTCEAGYRFDNKDSSISVRCSDHKWYPEDYPKKCAAIDCGPLPVIPNGNAIVSQDTHYGSTSHVIQCSDGYRIEGESKMTCLVHGKWTSMPLCKENKCATQCKAADNKICNEMQDPAVCICKEGFKKSEEKCVENKCVAECNEKDNKVCDQTRDPAVCICKEGFKKSKEKCVEITCVPGCNDADNKICDKTAGKPSCVCKPGFKNDTKLAKCIVNTCKSECKKADNKMCDEKQNPAVCICKEGFKKSEEKCVAIAKSASGMNYYTYLLIFAILTALVVLLIYFRTKIKNILGCDKSNGPKYSRVHSNEDNMEGVLGLKDDAMKAHIY